MNRTLSRLPIVVLALLLGSCGSPTDLHSDIDAARSDWVALNARDYVFEVSMRTSWTPTSGFYRVRVVNRQVAEAFDPHGAPTQGFSLTLDSVWEQILASRASDEVNAVAFDARGVPVETDLGPWAADGGRHYSVRRFARQR